MKSQFRAVNRFITKISSSSSINSSSESGTFLIDDISVGGFSLPQGNVTLFVTADFAQTGKEEIFRITNVNGNILTYDKRISVGGYVKPSHSAGASIRINDVADIINEMSEHIDNFGDVYKIEGTQTVKVWGGVFNYNGTIYNISNITLAITGGQLTDNTTNYIHFNFATQSYSVTASSTLINAVCVASVVTSGGSIGTITDLRPGLFTGQFAQDSNVLHLTGAETVSGTKTFSAILYLGSGGLMFDPDTSKDTGFNWQADGIINVRINATTVGEFTSLGYTGNAGGLIASTSNTIGVGNIELGHATDTTLSRVSAGKAAIEGVNIGTEGILQTSQSAAYTLVLTDAGKHIYHPSADTTARTWTIPANSSVAFPIGTAITFINDSSAGVITIAINTDTLVLAASGATGSRTLAANGIATAIKVTSTRWFISGVNIS